MKIEKRLEDWVPAPYLCDCRQIVEEGDQEVLRLLVIALVFDSYIVFW